MLANVIFKIFLSYRLLHVTVKLKIVCASDGFETWYLTLREEHRMRIFESTVQRKMFGPKRGRLLEAAVDYLMRSVIIFTPRTILVEVITPRRMKCTAHVVCIRVKYMQVFVGKT
jgi:hypothetical protein